MEGGPFALIWLPWRPDSQSRSRPLKRSAPGTRPKGALYYLLKEVQINREGTGQHEQREAPGLPGWCPLPL